TRHVAIPTTLSAAELSGLAGFTTEHEREKVGLRGAALIPSSVFFDAQLSLQTPLDLWLSTGIRAVDHAVETLLAAGSHPLPDVMRYLAPRTGQAQARIAAALGVDTREMPIEQGASRAADAVAQLIERLDLPRHLGAYGLSESDLEAAAQPVASAEYPLEDL